MRVARAETRAVSVLRPIRASAAGLGAGYLATVIAALWLRAAVPAGDLVWNLISPLRIAGFLLTLGHGVPLVVRSAAGVQAPQAPGSIGGLSELLGGGEDVVFSFSVVFVPIVLLAIVGITVALGVRRARPSSASEALRWSAVAAAIHGTVLAVVARLASVQLVAGAQLAPELGLGDATGHVALGIGSRPLVTFAIGAAWGAAFAAAGGLSALGVRTELDPSSRVSLLGWMHGLGTAAGTIAIVLALGGIVAVVSGRAPSVSLVGLGAFLVSANAVATGIVLAHGASMAVALDAGPFTGWERVDFLHVGVSGTAAPVYVWVIALLPIAAGVVAGRFVKRRTVLPDQTIALRYGALWGLTLAMLSLLLRVRVLSSVSVGALDLGGGSAAFDPVVALLLGFVWGTAGAFIGARTTRRAALSEMLWTCPACGISNTDDDRFCVSCGAVRA